MRRIDLFIFYCLILLFGASCKEDAEKHDTVLKEKQALCDFQTDSTVRNFNGLAVCQTSRFGTALTFYEKKSHVQFFYDAGGKELFRIVLNLPDSLTQNHIQISSLAINEDSILVCPMSKGKTIYLFDGKGALIRTFTSTVPLQDGISDYVLLAMPQSPILFDGQQILSVCTRLDVVLRSTDARVKYFSTPPYVLQNLKSGIAASNCGYWPEEYRNGISYRDFYPQHCLNSKKQIVFGFTASDSLYIMENGKLVSSHICKSKYMTERHPYPDDSIGHFAYLNRFEINEPRYISLIYDPFRNCYYRIVHHALEYESKDGMTVNSLLDKPWSVMILDEDFNVKGETIMDAKRFLPAVFPMKDGIYILQRKELNGIPPVRFSIFEFNS